MNALSERIQELAADAGAKPVHVEGTADSGWVLLDYGDVIVHIFSAALRDFYRIEHVWTDAATIVRVM